MNNYNFDLAQLVASYTPRQTGVSLVSLYISTGLLPSEIRSRCLENQTKDFGVNPDFTLLSSGKNNTKQYVNLIEKYQNHFSSSWKLISSDGFVFQRPSFILNNPLWVSTSQENFNFNKLYQSKTILLKLFYLPFVSQIYISGSQALEQSSQFSDIDLILESKSFLGLSTVIITRFWVKVYLKIINRDVHPFLIHYLWLFCKKIRWRRLEQKLEQRYLDFKKSPRIRLDVGLIIDQRVDLESYTTPDIDRLGYLLKKRVILQNDLSKKLEPSQSIFLNQIKYRFWWILKLFYLPLSIFSIIFYPLFLIQYVWFWLFNRHDINQFCNYYIWHSFTKVGFTKKRVLRLKNQKVYLYH